MATPFGQTAQIARVRDINGHRLTYTEARDMPDATVWRVLVSRRRYSKWEWVFDDLVLEPNLPSYLLVASSFDAERITLRRLGPVSWVLENYNRPEPRAPSAMEDVHRMTLDDFVSNVSKRRRNRRRRSKR